MGYFFLAPAVLYLIAFSIYPLIYAVNVSLRQFILSKPYLGMEWVGLMRSLRFTIRWEIYDNVDDLLDPAFDRALRWRLQDRFADWWWDISLFETPTETDIPPEGRLLAVAVDRKIRQHF